MAIALAITDIDNSGKSLYLTCTLTFSGNYSTGGDTIDFTTVAGKGYLGRTFQASKAPLYGAAYGTSGHSYGLIPGTTLANGKVKISTTAGTELGAGAYPAAITGDANIYCNAIFDMNL